MTLRRGFPIHCQWNLDSEFQSLVGFQIPGVGLQIQIQSPGFQITQAKDSSILYSTSKDFPDLFPESGLPDIERRKARQQCLTEG